MTLGAPSATTYHSPSAELSSSITLPATINAGDTIFLFSSEQATAPTITWPSGFTDSGITGSSRTNLSLWCSTKTATGSEGGTSVTVTSSATKARTVIAVVWAGTSGAFVGLGSAGATSVNTVCPDTPVAGNNYGVLAVSCQQGAGTPTWTPGTGYTEAAHDASGIAAACPQVVEYLADTGTITTTGTITNVSSVSNNWATMTLVVVPAGGTTINGDAAPTGAGVLTAGATQNAAVTITGAGVLTDTATQGSSASLAGAGVLSIGATQGSTVNPTGLGVLTAGATQRSSVTIAGAGVLVASSGSTAQGAAALTGAGSLTVSPTQGSGTSLVGAGSLTVGATQRTTSTLTGLGALVAGATQRAAVAIAGSGVLTAIGSASGSIVGGLVSFASRLGPNATTTARTSPSATPGSRQGPTVKKGNR